MFDICNECDGSIDYVEDYAFGVDPFTHESVYIHEFCREAFIERTGYGFCDLCDGFTWVAGFHSDPELDTDPETGNHVLCEAEYNERS